MTSESPSVMRIDILTLFPDMFQGPFDESIVGRAAAGGVVEICIHNIRDFTNDRHRTVDDYPYGGGSGMILKPEPLFAAVETVLSLGDPRGAEVPVVLLTPQGRLFDQRVAEELSTHPRILLLCGHYEGVDERVRQQLVTDELSIGDYVLSGGELAAMVVVDALVRLLPGALGSPVATQEDSHSWGLLEYPQYTRPAVFRGWEVPEILLSGHHAAIERWRRKQAIWRTLRRRPDLLQKVDLSPQEQLLVATEQAQTIRKHSNKET